MSQTGTVFSYAIGIIFAIGGLLFLIALDDNRYLFGIPYLVLGIVIIGGVRGSQRRMRRRAGPEGDPPAEPPGD
ncbi:MAG: hypothetical protein QOD86_1400 [Miltoncostaeaceae bacterium]|jgi:hypothetical protein|nr:hypothetical protein [Miltoncostaeaceae bacterium]